MKKILLVHNFYGERSLGGESMVVDAEANLLREQGYEVFIYSRSNNEFLSMSTADKLHYAVNFNWSIKSKDEFARVLDTIEPDVVHVHNYKFLITPSIFEAAKEKGIKTILTLHNYRLLVPCGNFMDRRLEICEKCFDGHTSRILVKRCSDGSFKKSLLQYALYEGTKDYFQPSSNLVDYYVCLTRFMRDKLVQKGVPTGKVIVKPNFTSHEYFDMQVQRDNNRALFIGRMSPEKGVLWLVENWRESYGFLDIIGGGPLLNEVIRIVSSKPWIKVHGQKDNETAMEMLSECSFLVFPSSWYEGMPITLLEGMAKAKPVLATELGARGEMILDEVSGYLYEDKNIEDFEECVVKLKEDRHNRRMLGLAARDHYVKNFGRSKSFEILKNLYN